MPRFYPFRKSKIKNQKSIHKFSRPSSQLPTPHSQKGLPAKQENALQAGQSTIYIVIILLVIIFSVMFVGGVDSLLSGGTASSVIDTPTPPQALLPTPTVTPSTPVNVPGWNIVVTLSDCISGNPNYKDGTVSIDGKTDGYVEISLNGATPQSVIAKVFKAQKMNYPLYLPNNLGFNNNPWKLVVYSGGSASGTNWSGGTVMAIYNGQPTGCN